MLIKVRVKTDAKNESIREKTADHFEISVREQPLENRANLRVRELIARHFNVRLAQVRIIKGHHSPSKILSI